MAGRLGGTRHLSALTAAAGPPLFMVLDAALTGPAALLASVRTVLTMKARARRDRAEDRTVQPRIRAEERAAISEAMHAINNQFQEVRKSTEMLLNREVDRARIDREKYEKVID